MNVLFLLPGLGGVPSYACGGFFCSTVPIDQSSEDVVFVQKGGDAWQGHVRIGFTGAAADFSWVVPVPGVPTLAVGTDELFEELAWRTAPAFVNVVEGDCVVVDDSDSDSDGVLEPDADGVADGDDVLVLSESVVGSYEATVVTAEDAEDLVDWFDCNGYRVAAGSIDRIQGYLDGGMNFLALKLVSGADVGLLTPLVMDYATSAPMVPLVLTGVAAEPNLALRVWVVAGSRAVPVNWDHVVVDPLRLGSGIGGYEDVLTHAIDEAGGEAFATDYAGSDAMMDRAIWFPERFDLEELRSIAEPWTWVTELLLQGFPRNAVMQGILRTQIPMPQELVDAGVSETAFYNCLSCYAEDLPPFDPVAATDQVEELVVAPMIEAQAIFDDPEHDTVTRLLATVSPWEMESDPVLAVLPEGVGESVPQIRESVLEYIGGDGTTSCNAPGIGAVVRTGLGVDLVIRAPDPAWDPSFPDERPDCRELPAALVVERFAADGTVTTVVDHRPGLRAFAPRGYCDDRGADPVPTEPPAGWEGDGELLPPGDPPPEVCAAFDDGTEPFGAGPEPADGDFPQTVITPIEAASAPSAGCGCNGAPPSFGVALAMAALLAACAAPARSRSGPVAARVVVQDDAAPGWLARLEALGIGTVMAVPDGTPGAAAAVDRAGVRRWVRVRPGEPDPGELGGSPGVAVPMRPLRAGEPGPDSAELEALVADCALADAPVLVDLDLRPAPHQHALERMLDHWPDDVFVVARMGGLANDLDRMEDLLLRHDNVWLETADLHDPYAQDEVAYRGFLSRRQERLIWPGPVVGPDLEAVERAVAEDLALLGDLPVVLGDNARQVYGVR